MERFTKKAAGALGQALECAGKMGHTYIGSEHILLGILREKDSIGARLLLSRGITVEKTEKKIIALVGSGTPRALSSKDMTPRLRRIIEQGFMTARRFGQNQVGTEHLLAALLREHPCTAATVLDKMGADPLSLLEMVTERLRMSDPMQEGRGKAPKVLPKYSTCLTTMAAMGQLDPLIGRQKELERMIVILSRRSKNNPCLVGLPGVGKTVMAEGLAQAIVAGAVPDHLCGKQIYQLELNSMVAGTKYRGEFEERIRSIVEECERNPDIILFIDEVHTLIGTGAAEGAIDAANILKPALSRGKVRLIGATTPEEYRKYIEKDSALERRFAPIIMEEATDEEALEVLRGLKDRFESFHSVEIGDEVLAKTVEFSRRYLHQRYLPDKAIDLLDEACSEAALRACHRRQGKREEIALFPLRVETGHVADVVSRMTGVPVGNILGGEEIFENLEQRLTQRIKGQSSAIETVVGAVRCINAGLGGGNRPTGCFLFAGPTGVGKTGLCQALSDLLFAGQNSFVKLDMSEYMEKHSVSRLIGAPPGYVGHDEGGKLVEAVRAHPYSLVLFDEIEKAHPDVCSLLLQIMEDGILTDSNGKSADFRHCLVVLTSNIGAASREIGFGQDKDKQKSAIIKALKTRFSPELINRLDEIVLFDPLSQNALEDIADTLLRELQDRLAKTGFSVEFAPDVAKFVAGAPETEQYGARPLRRFLRQHVEIPLSRAILEKRLGQKEVLDRERLESLCCQQVK